MDNSPGFIMVTIFTDLHLTPWNVNLIRTWSAILGEPTCGAGYSAESIGLPVNPSESIQGQLVPGNTGYSENDVSSAQYQSVVPSELETRNRSIQVLHYSCNVN
jgi:hypothetical protein